MSEHEITMAQAEIVAITEAWREACVERDALRRENAELKAILARSKTSLAEKFNDPMESGVCGEQSSAP